MGHQDKGHFAAKHNDRQINKIITKKLEPLADDNKLACAQAHQAGKALKVSPREIGLQADLLEYQITECQLGLFGHSDGEKKFDSDMKISPDLDKQLDTASRDGRISCLDCWDIAQKLKIKRLDVASACEKKKIRIKPCQLDIF